MKVYNRELFYLSFTEYRSKKTFLSEVNKKFTNCWPSRLCTVMEPTFDDVISETLMSAGILRNFLKGT